MLLLKTLKCKKKKRLADISSVLHKIKTSKQNFDQFLHSIIFLESAWFTILKFWGPKLDFFPPEGPKSLALCQKVRNYKLTVINHIKEKLKANYITARRQRNNKHINENKNLKIKLQQSINIETRVITKYKQISTIFSSNN